MISLLIRIFEISISLSPFMLFMLIFSKYADKRYQPKWKSWVWFAISVCLVIPIRLFPEQAPINISMPNLPLPQLPRPSTAYNISNENGFIQDNQTFSSGQGLDGSGTLSLSFYHVLAVVWILGILVILAYHFFHYIAYKKTLVRWGIPDERVQDKVSSLTQKNHIDSHLTVLVTKYANCPLVIGFLKKYIILPHSNYSDTEIQFILLHELTHIKKKHIWQKLVILFATSVHWFNPFTWLMKQQAYKDLEINCDSDVAAHCNNEQLVEYGNTILHCVCDELVKPPSLSTYFAGNKKMIKERIVNLGSVKMRKKGTYLIALSLAAILCMGSLVGCAIAKPQLPAPTGANSAVNTQNQTVFPSVDNSTNDEFLLAQQMQREAFGTYAKESGAFAGFHVENVARNTQNLPEGLDPHGFLVSDNLSFSELLEQRDNWLNEGISDGWIASDRKEMQSEILTLVYVDKSITAPYITSLIPAGNLVFTNPIFSNNNYAAFEFESGNNDMDMLWFYNLDKNKITMASTWVKPVDAVIDVVFEIDDGLKNSLVGLVNSLSENQSGVIFTNSLSEIKSTDYENMMVFTQSNKIDGTDDLVINYHVLDKRDNRIIFNGATALTETGESIIWSEAYEEYIIKTEEILSLAISLSDMLQTANSLI